MAERQLCKGKVLGSNHPVCNRFGKAPSKSLVESYYQSLLTTLSSTQETTSSYVHHSHPSGILQNGMVLLGRDMCMWGTAPVLTLSTRTAVGAQDSVWRDSTDQYTNYVCLGFEQTPRFTLQKNILIGLIIFPFFVLAVWRTFFTKPACSKNKPVQQRHAKSAIA